MAFGLIGMRHYEIKRIAHRVVTGTTYNYTAGQLARTRIGVSRRTDWVMPVRQESVPYERADGGGFVIYSGRRWNSISTVGRFTLGVV